MAALMPRRLLERIVDLRDHETASALWSFAYFFFLLSSYYILRPIRDEMGIAGGVKGLPWLFTGTFAAMLAAVPLYGAVCTRFSRRRIVPVVHRFFALNLVAFFILLQIGVSRVHVARVFFIWTSVYNLFIVSIFWSRMADRWGSEQAKRLFGFIAAGGSAGALFGPAITRVLVRPLGPVKLLLISALLLELSVHCAGHLDPRVPEAPNPKTPSEPRKPRMRGGLFDGIALVFRTPYLLGVSAQTLLLSTSATFLYFQQARIVAQSALDTTGRTELFANIDLTVNVISIVVQALFTGRIIKRLGLSFSLGLLPALTALGFFALSLAPGLWIIAAVSGVRRALHYAVERPAREVLFTVVGPEAKYKAKSFIDTVVYRGGDTASSWAYQGLAALGLGVAGTALAAIPLCIAWLGVSLALARRQETLANAPAGEAPAHRASLLALADAPSRPEGARVL